MTMEDIVRKHHQLEDRIARFQQQIGEFMNEAFCSMDTRSHEIAMARLYDMMTQATDEAIRIDHMFKGLLLKKTYSRRKAGEKPSIFSRFWHNGCTVNKLIKWKFAYPIPLTESLAQDWADGNSDSTRRLLSERNH